MNKKRMLNPYSPASIIHTLSSNFASKPSIQTAARGIAGHTLNVPSPLKSPSHRVQQLRAASPSAACTARLSSTKTTFHAYSLTHNFTLTRRACSQTRTYGSSLLLRFHLRSSGGALACQLPCLCLLVAPPCGRYPARRFYSSTASPLPAVPRRRRRPGAPGAVFAREGAPGRRRRLGRPVVSRGS